MTIKAVFHIDELPKWNLVLKNVQNLMKATESNVPQIEVLANSDAVRFYAGSTAANDDRTLMRELAEAGVRFAACDNALKGMGIARGQLPSFVEVVPVGVLELIEKQHRGFAYIKP